MKANQKEIHEVFNKIELFLKQDPLYMPYIFNETIDLAGLTRASTSMKEGFPGIQAYRQMRDEKVREIDRNVCEIPNQKREVA